MPSGYQALTQCGGWDRDGGPTYKEQNVPNKHGCCADKACNERTCMELPAGYPNPLRVPQHHGEVTHA